MSLKEKLLQELEQTPDSLIQEVLDFLRFLKLKRPIPPAPRPLPTSLYIACNV